MFFFLYLVEVTVYVGQFYTRTVLIHPLSLLLPLHQQSDESHVFFFFFFLQGIRECNYTCVM